MIFVDSERKNEFNGDIATYGSESYYASYYSFDNFWSKIRTLFLFNILEDSPYSCHHCHQNYGRR